MARTSVSVNDKVANSIEVAFKQVQTAQQILNVYIAAARDGMGLDEKYQYDMSKEEFFKLEEDKPANVSEIKKDKPDVGGDPA